MNSHLTPARLMPQYQHWRASHQMPGFAASRPARRLQPTGDTFVRSAPGMMAAPGLSRLLFAAATANFRNQDLTGPNFAKVLAVKNLHGADFTNAAFSAPEFNGKSLTGAIFNNARLKKTNFTAAILEDCKFVGPRTDLTEAYFDWTKISRADFTGAKLDDASLSSAKGRETVFDYASLRRIHLTDSTLPKASFKNADLTEADLRGTHFNEPDLDNVPFYKRLEGIRRLASDFSGAKMHGADLTGASLVGASMKNVRMAANDAHPGATLFNTNFQYADLSRADLRGLVFERSHLGHANLTDADLAGADLSKIRPLKRKSYPLYGVDWTRADLSRANLQNLDLEEARFPQTQLRGANLEGASLHGADLGTALIDEMTRWTGAKYSGRTRFPAGFDPLAHGMIYEPRLWDRLPFNRNEAETQMTVSLNKPVPPPEGGLGDADKSSGEKFL